jgi:hypothetical protein
MAFTSPRPEPRNPVSIACLPNLEGGGDTAIPKEVSGDVEETDLPSLWLRGT